MQAGQTSVRNGVEDILYPMPVMRLTQGDMVGTHKGTYAVDDAGKDGGRDLAYFPFSAKSVVFDGSAAGGNAVVWESLKQVRFANGTIDYACIMVVHDNDPTGFEVGRIYKQGQQMAQEGTAGKAQGNHLHFEIAKGKYQRGKTLKGKDSMYQQNSDGTYYLKNNIPIERACFVDGTEILQGIADWKYLEDVKTSNNTGGNTGVSNSASKGTISIKDFVEKWTVHRKGELPTNKNIVGTIAPKSYGGLTYTIIDRPHKDTITIKSSSYGEVNLYLGGVDKSWYKIR